MLGVVTSQAPTPTIILFERRHGMNPLATAAPSHLRDLFPEAPSTVSGENVLQYLKRVYLAAIKERAWLPMDRACTYD